MFEEVACHKNDALAAKMTDYMMNQIPFLGVPKSILKAIIRPYLNEAKKNSEVDWDFVNLCWEKKHREYQYIGIVYLFALKHQLTDQDIDKIKYLITNKSWWDVTDELDKVIGMLADKYPGVDDLMINWSKSDNKWLRRVSISYEHHKKSGTNARVLKQILCNNLEVKDFFITRSVGWALRDYSKINPKWVEKFLQQYHSQMELISFKEASKSLSKCAKK